MTKFELLNTLYTNLRTCGIVLDKHVPDGEEPRRLGDFHNAGLAKSVRENAVMVYMTEGMLSQVDTGFIDKVADYCNSYSLTTNNRTIQYLYTPIYKFGDTRKHNSYYIDTGGKSSLIIFNEIREILNKFPNILVTVAPRGKDSGVLDDKSLSSLKNNVGSNKISLSSAYDTIFIIYDTGGDMGCISFKLVDANGWTPNKTLDKTRFVDLDNLDDEDEDTTSRYKEYLDTHRNEVQLLKDISIDPGRKDAGVLISLLSSVNNVAPSIMARAKEDFKNNRYCVFDIPLDFGEDEYLSRSITKGHNYSVSKIKKTIKGISTQFNEVLAASIVKKFFDSKRNVDYIGINSSGSGQLIDFVVFKDGNVYPWSVKGYSKYNDAKIITTLTQKDLINSPNRERSFYEKIKEGNPRALGASPRLYTFLLKMRNTLNDTNNLVYENWRNLVNSNYSEQVAAFKRILSNYDNMGSATLTSFSMIMAVVKDVFDSGNVEDLRNSIVDTAHWLIDNLPKDKDYDKNKIVLSSFFPLDGSMQVMCSKSKWVNPEVDIVINKVLGSIKGNVSKINEFTKYSNTIFNLSYIYINENSKKSFYEYFLENKSGSFSLTKDIYASFVELVVDWFNDNILDIIKLYIETIGVSTIYTEIISGVGKNGNTSDYLTVYIQSPLLNVDMNSYNSSSPLIDVSVTDSNMKSGRKSNSSGNIYDRFVNLQFKLNKDAV